MARPGASIRLLSTKLGLLLNDFELPDNQDIEFVRLVAAPRLAWGIVSFGWLIPWAAVGLFRGDRSAFWWFLATSTVAGLGSTAAFFVVARYRIPWVPGLALLGSAGLVDLARRARGRRWGALIVRVVLVGAPVAALAWRPLADPVPDRWGHAEIVLAVAELGESHLEPAIDALDDARAFNPGAAGRVGEITASGPIHDRLAELVRSRIDLNRGRDGLVESSPMAPPGPRGGEPAGSWNRPWPPTRTTAVRSESGAPGGWASRAIPRRVGERPSTSRRRRTGRRVTSPPRSSSRSSKTTSIYCLTPTPILSPSSPHASRLHRLSCRGQSYENNRIQQLDRQPEWIDDPCRQFLLRNRTRRSEVDAAPRALFPCSRAPDAGSGRRAGVLPGLLSVEES